MFTAKQVRQGALGCCGKRSWGLSLLFPAIIAVTCIPLSGQDTSLPAYIFRRPPVLVSPAPQGASQDLIPVLSANVHSWDGPDNPVFQTMERLKEALWKAKIEYTSIDATDPAEAKQLGDLHIRVLGVPAGSQPAFRSLIAAELPGYVLHPLTASNFQISMTPESAVARSMDIAKEIGATIERRIKDSGNEASVEVRPGTVVPELLVKVGKPADAERIRIATSTPAFLEFSQVKAGPYPSIDALFASSKGVLPLGVRYAFAGGGKPPNGACYLISRWPAVTGHDVIRARTLRTSNGRFAIEVEFNAGRASLVARLLEANIGERFAVLIDGKIIDVLTAVTPNPVLRFGEFSQSEAATTAWLLNAGPLGAAVVQVTAAPLSGNPSSRHDGVSIQAGSIMAPLPLSARQDVRTCQVKVLSGDFFSPATAIKSVPVFTPDTRIVLRKEKMRGTLLSHANQLWLFQLSYVRNVTVGGRTATVNAWADGSQAGYGTHARRVPVSSSLAPGDEDAVVIQPREPLPDGLYVLLEQFPDNLEAPFLFAVGEWKEFPTRACADIRKADADFAVPATRACTAESAAVPPSATSGKSMIGTLLDQSYPGWTIQRQVSADDAVCFDTRSGFPPYMVWGDLNGDGRRDLAVKFRQGGLDHIVAFLSEGRTFRAVSVATVKITGQGAVGDSLLTLEPKGAKYFDHEKETGGVYPFATLTLVFCEKSSLAYIYENGKFRKVFVSD